MNIGLIARADARGLGHITREFFRHLRPAKTLVVIPEQTAGHAQHPEWYPASRSSAVSRVAFTDERGFPEGNMRTWLSGLDVVYTAETFYDHRAVRWAADMGVATVCHVNPEFYVADEMDAAPPTAIWNQSPWRHDTLPASAVVMPVPVATDRFAAHVDHDGPLRVLHVVGASAANDRNGTGAVLAALRHVDTPVDVTFVTQGRRGFPLPPLPRHVNVSVQASSGDYWEMYTGFDALVTPRRYAGQSLPTQEAMAAGLAVVMSDCSPNEWWTPVIRVPAAATTTMRSPGGTLDVYDTCPWQLAETISALAADRNRVAEARSAGIAWAANNSWDTLADKYRTALLAVSDTIGE